MRLLPVILFSAALVAPLVGRGAAKDPSPPRTVEEHLATARSYKEKAESAHHNAELHRTMIERYFYYPGGKAGVIQETDKWYLDHCQRFIDQANALATTASDLAGYHEKKADELKKKKAP